MKRLLLLALTAAAVIAAGATEPYIRSTGTNNGTVKKMNTRRHFENPVRERAPQHAAAEVPENAIEVPFNHQHGKDSPVVDIIKQYTIINSNNDGREWKVGTVNKYSACMAPATSGVIEVNDDWLITVPIHMPAGKYSLKYDLGIMGTTAKGVTMEVKLGTAPTAEAMTTVVSPVTFYDEKNQTTYEAAFNITEEGYYYIGFHSLTTKEEAGTIKLFSNGVEALDVPENAVEAPFSHNLGKNSSAKSIVENYNVTDANEDGRTWKLMAMSDYTPCMPPNAADIETADDWLITVPVFMETGDYIVELEHSYMGTGATGTTLEIKLGTAPTVEGMIAEILPPTVFESKEQTVYEYNCAIPKAGYYYIGVHSLTTKAQKATVKLHSIGVKKGEAVVVDPPAAGTLSYELAPKGELKAHLIYTAPTKGKSGDDLAAISKVEITSRWGVDKFTFDDVKPGQTIELDVDMYKGSNNRFTATAYVGDTAGETVEYKSIFCGPDTPLAPTDVKLVTSADYSSVTLSWTAPGEKGEHGGYVDPDNLVYYVFDAFGTYYDPAIATTDKTSITINFTDLQGQDFVAYQVTAGNAEGYSIDTSSNIATIGTPDELPFTESFTNGYYDGLWALNPATGTMMNAGTVSDDYFASLTDPEDPDAPAPLASHDGDNGFYFWLPYEKDVMLGLISLRADISKAANPVLEFWYQGQGSTFEVFVAAGTGDFELAKSINLKENPATGWTLAQIPLSQYKAAGAVQFELRLTATHNDDEHTWSVPFDDISIRDLVDTDMRLVAPAVPAKTKVGTVLSIPVHAQNLGTLPTAASAELYVNGSKVAETDLGTVEVYAFADATFTYTVPMNAPEALNIKVAVVADGDSYTANNESEIPVTVLFPNYPAVTDLAAVAAADGSSVTLSWTIPSTDELKKPVVVFEDFESDDYTKMSISGAGGWTVYDGDKTKTYNIFRETYNPYQTAPIGFQLFDREYAEVPSTYWEDAAPHSGTTFMLAPSAQGKGNDNWLISPELSGNAQTVSFWAKSYTVAWPESFEVYYSTTGNTVDCFTVTVEVENYPATDEVPEEWTEFKAALPEGAKYFAIHHNAYDTLALFVDDVTFEAVPEVPDDLAVEGFHIFRDGVQLTDIPVAETNYTDRIAASRADESKTYIYSVIAVYNHGTAKGTDITVDVHTSGIETVTAASIGGTDRLYNLSGIEVDPAKADAGIYILVRDNRAAKVALR